jgi:glycosyltransferase involved in cell wall biosynthesis
MKRPAPSRVALVMVAVADLSGSGGAERHFSDLFDHLRTLAPDGVTFITSRASVARLRHAGRLQRDDGIVALPLGNRPARTRAGIIWMTLMLAGATLGRGFDVVHICLPTPSYVPYAALITRLPRAWRPRVTLTVLDCTLAHHLMHGGASDLYEQQVLRAHQMYFRWTRLDAIYTWYRAFVHAAQSLRLLPAGAVLTAARYCFTDPARFAPQPVKSRTVVYAGRLSAQKRPLLFVDAVAALLRRHADVARGWNFEMYGGGVLESQVRARIAALNLGGVIMLTSAPDLAPVFARSQIFVSTQAFENFTSLAMLEAMAAGNVLVAEDAGQTNEFVRDGKNGILVSEATPDAFADAIARLMQYPERFAEMGAESRRLATEVHTIEHFAADIVSFWSDVAGGRANT